MATNSNFEVHAYPEQEEYDSLKLGSVGKKHPKRAGAGGTRGGGGGGRFGAGMPQEAPTEAPDNPYAQGAAEAHQAAMMQQAQQEHLMQAHNLHMQAQAQHFAGVGVGGGVGAEQQAALQMAHMAALELQQQQQMMMMMHGGGADMFDQQQGFAGAASSVKIGQPGFAPRPRFGKPTPSPQPQPWKKSTKPSEERSATANEEGSVAPAVTTETQEESGVRATKPDETTTVAEDKVEEVSVRGTAVSNNNNHNNDDDDDNDDVQKKESVEVDGRGADPEQVDQGSAADASSTPAPAATGGDEEGGDGEKSGTPDPSDAAAEAATTSEAPAPAPRERVRPTNTNSRQYYLYQQQQHREKRNDAVYNPSGEACCTPEEEERHAEMDERRKEFCKDMPPQARKNPALGAKKNKTPQGDFPPANMPMDANPVFKNREFMNENPPAAPHPAKALVQASLEKAAAVLERQLDVDAQPWKPPGAIDPVTSSVPTDAAGASSTIVGGGDSTSLGGAAAITSSSGVAIPAPPALGTVPASGLPDPLGAPSAGGADGQPPVLQIGLSVKMLQNVDAQMREAQAQYHAAVQQVEMRHQALTLVLAKPRMEAQVFVKEREALLSNTSVDIGKVPRASDFLPVPVQELKQQEFPPQGRPSDDDLVHYTLKLIEKKTDIAMKLTELETSRDALTLALHLEKQRNEMMAQALKFLIQENQTLCAAVAGQHAEQSAATALLAQAQAQQAQSPVVPATGKSSVTDGASANPFDTLRSEVTLKTTTAAADGSSPSGAATATDMSNDLQSMLMKIRAGGSSGEVPDSHNTVGVDALASAGDESAGDKAAAIMSAFGAALPTTTAGMPDFDPSTFAGLGELMADSGREATPLADTPLLVDLASGAADENAVKTKDDKTVDERSVAAPAPSALPKPKSKQTFESVKQMKHPSPGTSPPPEPSSSSAAVAGAAPTKMLQQGPLGRLPNPKSRAAKLQQEQDEAAAKAAAEAAAEAAAAQIGSARAANAGMNILSAPPVSSAKVVVSEPVMKAHQKAVAAVTYIGSKVTLLQQQLTNGDVLIDEAKAQIKVCEDELVPLEHELTLMQASVDESMIDVQCAVLNSTRQAIAAASAAAGVPAELAAPTLGAVDPTSMLAAAGLPVALGAGPSAGNDGQELAEAAALAFIEDDDEVVVGDYNTVDVPTTASKPKATGVQALLQVTNETPRAAPDTTALLKAALKIPQQQEPNDLVAATSAAMAREAALQAQVRSQAHTAAPLLGNAPSSDDIWGTVAAATADDITGTVNMMFSGGLATYNEDDVDDNDQEVDDAEGNAAADDNVVAAGTTTASADSALANGGNALGGDAAGSSILSGDAEGSVTSGANAKEGKKQKKRAQVQEYRALGTVDAPFEELAKNLDFMTVFAHDFTKPTVQDVTLFDIQNPEHFAKRPEMRVGATFHRNLFTTKIPVPAPWTKHEKSDRRNASAKKHCDCFYFHNYLREKVENECVRIFVGHIPTSDNITPDAVALGLFRMFASHCGTPNAVVHVVVFTKLDPIERTACVWILPDYYQWVLELDDVLYTSGEMPFSIVVEPTEPRKEKDDRDRDNQRSINQKAGSRGRNSGAPRGAPFGKFGAALATSDYERTHPKNVGAANGGMPMPFNQHHMMLQQMAVMQHNDYGNPSAEAATMWQAEMMAAGAGFQGSQDSYGDSSFNKGQYRASAGRGGAGRGGGRGGRGGGRGRAGFSAENETAARMMSGFGMDY